MRKPKLFFLLFVILLWLAVENAYAFELVGTWKLISIERQNANNQWVPDCHSPSGLLIYTSNGYMSAGVNCMKPNTNQPSFSKQDITFYMGTYSIKKDSVTHHVLNANSENMYGKNLLRKIQIIDNNNINLTLKNKNNNLLRLKWKKISG